MENEKAGGYVSVSYVGTKEDIAAAEAAKEKASVEETSSDKKVNSKNEK